MSTLSLFEGRDRPAGPAPALRDYQIEAIDAVCDAWRTTPRTMIVLPTGVGKTQIACGVVDRRPGRTLFIAHRQELIDQAARRLRQFGHEVEIEKAEQRATRGGRAHVVASIQTIHRRVEQFDPREFAVVIIDEVHHAVGNSYRKVIDRFSGAKILGLTATPDRLDGEALGSIVDSVAYEYTIQQAMDDGWLCPVSISRVKVSGIDLSALRTVAGDFEQGELDRIMSAEENLHKVARPTVELAGGRKTIIFCVSVVGAHKMAEVIDRYAGKGKAFAIDGTTQADDRRGELRAFAEGRRQFFCNVGIATEGYDQPDVACISMARPTKSRALYTQMIGRGLRGGAKFPIEGKTDCLVVDFTANSGKHELVKITDIFAGHEKPEVVERAEQIIGTTDGPIEIDEAIRQARAQLAQEQEAARLKMDAERLRGVVVDVSYEVMGRDPFAALGVERDYLTERFGYGGATEPQILIIARKLLGKRKSDGIETRDQAIAALKKEKMDAEKLSKREASRLIDKLVSRQQDGRSTYAQARALAKFGWDARGWSFDQASSVMSLYAANGWRPYNVSAQQVLAIVGDRQPGEEG
jgi:superfamily II DNA or RNA helicase